MKIYLFLTFLLGIGTGLFIFLMVRRNLLQVRLAIYWLLVAISIILFGIFPGLSDIIARKLGIVYSPILVIIVGMLFLFIKALDSDIKLSKKEEQIRELSQKIALLESEVWQKQFEIDR